MRAFEQIGGPGATEIETIGPRIEAVSDIHGLSLELAWPVRRVRNDTSVRYPDHRLVMPEQVHGNRIEVVSRHSPGSIPGADGLVFRDTQVVAAITGADCLPIAFQGVEWSALAHAGWRGTLQRIGRNVLEALTKTEGVGNIQVYLGPCIGPCHFQVDGSGTSTNLAREFRNQFGSETIRIHSEATYVDLRHATMVTLMDAGIQPDRIHVDPRCTVCSHGTNPRLPSYRRDRDVSQLLVVSATRKVG